eukprot:scpid71138/ scgid34015/ Protein phosphatase Slingshot homolog 1; SSH-like protein 1
MTNETSYGHIDFINHVEPQLSFLREGESIIAAGELVCHLSDYRRCLLVVSHGGSNGTNGNGHHHSIVGIHYCQSKEEVSLSLHLPVHEELKINLVGDGEVQVTSSNQHDTDAYYFKPCTIHELWKIVAKLFQVVENHADNDCESQPWYKHYHGFLTQEGILLNEWTSITDTKSGSGRELSDSKGALNAQVRVVLSRVMGRYEAEELENFSSKALRELCEKEMGRCLVDFRGHIDNLILEYMGRADKASEIFDFLYLGSEWNASDLDFMTENNVKKILNVAGEIQNFFSGNLTYHNIRVDDVPSTDLLRYFEDTYTFLKEAKTSGDSVFVHCKMGVSRSATVVIAFAMKEHQWSLQETLDYVRQRRAVVQPNKGFMLQLLEYEGILAARNNKVWGQQASQHEPSPAKQVPTC